MLTFLKESINKEKEDEFLTSVLMENKIAKKIFLDDLDSAVIGAEQDPGIKTLVDTIPEYDDNDELIEAEINSMVESLIETNIL